MTRIVVRIAVLLCAVSCSPSGPCPRGQELREERFVEGVQLRARGCVGKDADGNYRLQGKWEWFHKNGQREAEGEFKNGVMGSAKEIPQDGREGKWMFWYDNGQKEDEGIYKDGKQEGLTTRWYQNGQKQSEHIYKAGNPEGLVAGWYENGQKQSEGTLKGGKLDGPTTAWYENGSKLEEKSYRDGKPEGPVVGWYENGQKKNGVTYLRGKLHQSHAVETMNNNGWQRARKAVGLQDVRVHDLRHTVGMRLREAGVREETISDILWHSRGTMTAHYSVAQVRELLDALNLITDEGNRTNANLEMLFREKSESLQSPFKRKTG